MAQLPYDPHAGSTQPSYHVIPDNIQGGWLVYTTNKPQEPQVHFDTQEEAIAYAEKTSVEEGVGYVVENYEAPPRAT